MVEPYCKMQINQSYRFCTAPMMEWTDRIAVSFTASLRAGRGCIRDGDHRRGVSTATAVRLIGFDASEHPVALQLGGSNPAISRPARRSARISATTRSI